MGMQVKFKFKSQFKYVFVTIDFKLFSKISWKVRVFYCRLNFLKKNIGNTWFKIKIALAKIYAFCQISIWRFSAFTKIQNNDVDRDNPVKTIIYDRVLLTVIFFEKRLLSDSFFLNLEQDDFKKHN